MPLWVTVIWHVPATNAVITPDSSPTVQIPVVLLKYLTSKPELAVVAIEAALFAVKGVDGLAVTVID